MLRSDLAGVRALPLLSGLADFDKIDGKMQAKLAFAPAAPASARSWRLERNGLRRVPGRRDPRPQHCKDDPVAHVGHAVGMAEGRDQATDLTQLSASFRVEQGQATTSDLTLAGPLVRMTGAGTVDLAAKTWRSEWSRNW